jgi:hypothetical protein
VISLLVIPPAGWAALHKRWAGCWSIPAAIVTTLVLASAYYYRDGLEYGMFGLVPGQRFLLPASALACVPAARVLSGLTSRVSQKAGSLALAVAMVALFVVESSALSALHQSYLSAHAAAQRAVRQLIPDGARVVSDDRAFRRSHRSTGDAAPRAVGSVPRAGPSGACVVWLGRREAPPAPWFSGRTPTVVRAESWLAARPLDRDPSTVGSS